MCSSDLMARIAESVKVMDDIVQPYCLLSTAYDATMATWARLCTTRVVCANTIAYAETESYLRANGDKEQDRARFLALIREERDAAYPPDVSGHNLFPADRSAYKLFVLASDAGSIVDQCFRNGVPEWKNGSLQIKPGTKGLIEIFRPLNKIGRAHV